MTRPLMKGSTTKKGSATAKPRSNTNKDNISSRYSKSPAIKHLEMMALEAVKKKYPMIPYPVAKKFRDDTANGLTKCILDFLKLYGHQAERISNTGRPVDQRMTFMDVLGNRRTIGCMAWIPGTGTRGTADISATIAGKSVKIEVKAGRDRQSRAQRDYQVAVEAAGGLYYIASSFAEFLNWYNQTFRQ